MENALPPPVAARVERIAALARERGIAVYLVGGIVRDLLLGHPGQDLDLVVEGDGLGFAAALAEELGGTLKTHSAFLTTDLIDAEGHHLDIATARREVYPAPAALPEVSPGSLRDDLFRRDFTVNAMALRLDRDFSPGPAAAAPASPAGPGALAAGARQDVDSPPQGSKVASAGLIDPFGGRRDLAARTLRVLHARSFLDDPTRVLRGVRLERRLDFHISEETERLAREALTAGAFDRLSGSRLLNELILLFDEPRIALPGLERLDELGVLAALHPRLRLPPESRERLRAVIAELGWYRAAAERAPTPTSPDAPGPAPPRLPPVAAWLLLLIALAAELDTDDREALARRLLLDGDDRRLVVGSPSRLVAARAVVGSSADLPKVPPHRIDEALSTLAGEELVLLAASGDPATREAVWHYLTTLRGFALAIRGADLLAAGAPAGPAVGRALRAARRARLDGKITAGEELAFALAWLAEHEPRAQTRAKVLAAGAPKMG